MNKLMKILGSGLLAAFVAVSAMADTTSTYTNALGQVVTVVVSADGTKVTTITQPTSGATTRSRTVASLVGLQISTSAVVTPTSYTPRDVGDILVGIVDGTVHVATGVTTSSWKTVALSAQTSAATPVVATAATPRYIGDMLVGTATNMVFVSKGLTTNDWVQVEP